MADPEKPDFTVTMFDPGVEPPDTISRKDLPDNWFNPFTIEPPINVISPDFLNNAFLKQGNSGQQGIQGFDLTFSNEDVTHGFARIHGYASSSERERILRGDRRKEICRSLFDKTLNPMGDKTVEVVFIEPKQAEATADKKSSLPPRSVLED